MPLHAAYFNIDTENITKLAEIYGTPLFIMNEKGMIDRFHALKKAAQIRYPHSIIALSYKTNFLKGLLYRLHQEGAHAEVVSGIEYAIAKEIKQSNQLIIFNGPYKTDDELTQAIMDGAYIHCDHEEEIDRIEILATKLKKKITIGLRLYFTDSDSSWSRFGIVVDSKCKNPDFLALITKINQSTYLSLGGLHSHIGTNIRDLKQFKMMATYLCGIAQQLKKQFSLELSWLDVGGGLAGISPYRTENQFEPHSLPDANDYMEAIIPALMPYLASLKKPATLIFEPGRTLFEAFGGLLAQVVGIRHDQAGMRAVILNAGNNMLSTSHVYHFPIQCFLQHTMQGPTHQLTRLLGPTCNQADQLHDPLLLPCLQRDDLLLFYGVGSYCMAFSYSFIRFRPGVILWRGEANAVWLREPETVANNAITGYLPIELVS